MYEVYLAHHGILGQKWGIRRYQNADGSLTAAGRKRYAIDEDGKIRKLSGSERRAAVKTAKQRTEALEKARKTRAEKAEYNKEKAEAIKSGDASKINKYFNDLSPAEMKEAMDRINTKQNFQKMLNNEAQIVSSGKTTTDRLMETVGKVTNYAETGIKMYNVIAKINNAFNDSAYMPSIDGKWAGDRKREVEKQRREDADAERERKEKRAKEKEDARKERVLNTGSADEILKYAKKHGNVSASELGTSIKRMQNEEGLRKISRGGEEASKVLKSGGGDSKEEKNKK